MFKTKLTYGKQTYVIFYSFHHVIKEALMPWRKEPGVQATCLLSHFISPRLAPFIQIRDNNAVICEITYIGGDKRLGLGVDWG